ncbi:metal-dependent hydrolase [Neopusillimonas maritima]|uniref:Hydrolase n=1 Tax=Neopusillimonas maritima TaxID=2026239 RepID=A0A3A1Z179_9BURK|nr:metal-dependent hydrolase [Neopusillimonas maritima]RIY42127.1 hydrolase [Neopusillimonas maritima]
MDSVTQAVLGASVTGVMLGRFHGRKAYVAGAVLATLPDLDVIIDYGNPIANMIYHRGFSHSVFVLTLFSLLLTWLFRLWPPTHHYSKGRLFLTLWLIFMTHVLLDALTSYGTQLFWPWHPTPTSVSSIFIIDPFFTLPLLIAAVAGIAAGARPGVQRFNGWVLGYCALYLAASVIAKNVTEARVRAEFAESNIEITDMFSTPAPFNILLWRVMAKTPDDHYYEMITGFLDDKPGERIRLPLNSKPAHELTDNPMLDGLRWFSGGWLRYDEIDNQLVATDLRMGLGTGYYSFRFKVAQRDPVTGQWRSTPPERWRSERGVDALGNVLTRIIHQKPPLPLASWETRMTR